MKSYTLVSPCFFGMEKMLAREIKELGFEIVKTEDGRVTYKTGEDGIAKANMWLRCAERVHLKIAEFEAKTFDELFENTKRIDWSRYIPYEAEFPVSKASSIKSKLYSTTHIQSIVKKAIVDSLKAKYMERGLLKECKEKYPIYVFIHKDIVTLYIDTTGDALHKRGYRERANKAPIRETLAAGIVDLTPWKPGRILVDPMCGSGTMLIEAAMKAINMAPGMNREFISEKWRTIDKKIWWDVRKDAYEKINEDVDFKIYGYDIDEETIEIAKENAEIAGVDKYIEFNVLDATKFKSDEEYGFIITNPPYGERLEDKESVQMLYRNLGKAFFRLRNWSYYLITSYDEFEKEFGKQADKKRKLYNGMLKTNLYQYIGPKPPRK
ncbi:MULTISPECIES: THUMP domain-containing class I SAM-dependent RNA methyltransferase [Romboutsia]|uniref:Ribosomal RNA large subunit methyltransferase K/L n=1 Tax=Romboutsia hominis TaxID=1507512 RepID=A0A2P2BS07_9FIRM|nr:MULTISPECIES: class I SAM-dependent RNA methyltransferase [Romboutsia]MDB8805967.1 class I SAM-dependent RNA methyltransferase [Romboutsia sp. 1001216sp1]MDB8807589.1 class I SAM-dependent RNA methyltransferase [Romboutsia sp. 1001216sp1]MDB8811212.1 class I SAM-dependent RNA methyltransferase [Romboutsia sp. 1001216sp1]MDB8816932.1 class I SAM-dependent RNA methyltransferase [Romboutsia sp. 1001216sp1]MDB8819550.1 class I SAM-dependent RNA methyltransferase [Romboutsia sp. 1001216sp1]